MNTTLENFNPMQNLDPTNGLSLVNLITYGITYFLGGIVISLIWLLIGILVLIRTENPLFLIMYVNLTGFFWLTSADVYSKYILLLALVLSFGYLIYKIFISFERRKYE